tara:strand:- start:3041 stop:3526 length:486 start_codon:yes stop_codon:yes gene_type:complete
MRYGASSAFLDIQNKKEKNMKFINNLSKSVVRASLLAVSLSTMSNTASAQAEIFSLFSLNDGPLATLYTPVDQLGLFPRSLENGGVFLIAGSDILLSGENPIDTLLSLGGPLKGQLIPIFDVLVDNPLTTVDYVLGGGTIISPGLTIVPQLPLLNSPLVGL